MKLLNTRPWLKPTMYPNYDNAANLGTSHGKIIGFSATLDVSGNITGDVAFAKTKGVTKFNRLKGSEIEPLNNADKFEVMLPQDYGLDSSTTASQAYTQGMLAASSFTQDSVIFDQFTESDNPISEANYWLIANRFYKGLKDMLVSGYNMYGRYNRPNSITDTPKFNLNNGGYNSNPLHSYFVNGLKNTNDAKLRWNKSTQATDGIHPFFQQYGDGSNGGISRMSDFMGMMVSAINGFNEPDDTLNVYEFFYQIQRNYAAGINHQVIFHTIWSEAVTLATDVQGKNTGWKVKRDDVQNGAYWEIKDHHMTPPNKTLFLSFIGILLTKGIANFDAMSASYNKDVTKLKNDDYLSGLNQFNWRSNPQITAPALHTGYSGYPTKPLSVQDLYLVALDMYETHVKPLLDLGLQLKYLPYTCNGDNVDVDVSETSDTRLFTNLIKPYGQHQILHAAANKKAICFGGRIGNRALVVWWNGFQNPSAQNNLYVNFSTSNVSGFVTTDVTANGMFDVGVVSGQELQVFVF